MKEEADWNISIFKQKIILAISSLVKKVFETHILTSYLTDTKNEKHNWNQTFWQCWFREQIYNITYWEGVLHYILRRGPSLHIEKGSFITYWGRVFITYCGGVLIIYWGGVLHYILRRGPSLHTEKGSFITCRGGVLHYILRRGPSLHTEKGSFITYWGGVLHKCGQCPVVFTTFVYFNNQ